VLKLCISLYIALSLFRETLKVFGLSLTSQKSQTLLSIMPMVCLNLTQKVHVPDTEVGGGFSMGSSYFYLEFLLVWLSLLKMSGFQNPAIFALDYTLVPDACHPVQLQQAIAGYKHVLSITQDSSKICVGGDSAGGAIILSFLLHLAHSSKSKLELEQFRPGMALLISPWVTLVSSKDRNTRSDYLDVSSLQIYARQYAGPKVSVHDPLISAGKCKDPGLWIRASPSKGFGIIFGEEEVFAPEIRYLITLLQKAGTDVDIREEKGGIHCWPVAALYLSGNKKGRQKGLKLIVDMIQESFSRNAKA
jgi:acetyl esterase/lipase